MASGQSVVQILQIVPPAANGATVDTRPGGSTPAEAYPVHDFDTTTIEFLDYICQLVSYGGGGLTFVGKYTMTSAITGVVGVSLAIFRLSDDNVDSDVSHTYDYNSTTDTVPNVLGELGYWTITFTNGSDMDSVADGEVFILRLRRDTGVGSNAAGDMEHWGLVGKET